MSNKSNSAAQTGSGPTAMVAIEQHFPPQLRIIDDDLAYRILPFGIRAFIQLTRLTWIRDWMVRATEKQVRGIWGGIVCRKRYIDDKVVEAVEKQGMAVVNLGAGFDTRAYRLPALHNTSVWEVDQAVNIDVKQSRLRTIFGDIPAHVKLVSINFEHETLEEVLASHGYTSDTKTFFVWEAVTQYLSKEGFETTFDFLSKAPAGSRLAFTYVLRDFIEGENLYGQEPIYKRMRVKEKIWHFGINPDEVADILGAYGWKLLEDLSYQELADQYVKPTGRNLPSMEIERMVYAERI